MTRSDALAQSTPEAQGIPSAAITAFVREAQARLGGLDSLILLRHGHLVAAGWWAPYAPAYPHELFSLTKSFTSTAVGLAVAEERLTVDDPVLSFFPQEAPTEVSAHLAALQVRHLLTMTVGHAETLPQPNDRQGSENWVKAFLAHPIAHAPGTQFLYNSRASDLLSAIVQRCTGEPLVDYLGPRLFAPLGIARPAWHTLPGGVCSGAWGLRLRTEDIARFGQMILQGGVWQGQRILPAAWVAQAIARQVDNAPADNPDWAQGYGYQFWRCRHGAVRGDGMYSQFCIVMPNRDVVLAITGGVDDMQAVLDLVWTHLLPAMGPDPLPADRGAQRELEGTLDSLAHAMPQGAVDAPAAARVSGRTYHVEENAHQVTSVCFDFSDGGVIAIQDAHGTRRIDCGQGSWRASTTAWSPLPPQRIVASGAWTAADTYQATLCLIEWPFRLTLTCRFAGDRVTIETGMNVSMGQGLLPPSMVGHAE